MLVLSRRIGEKIVIGDGIVVTVVEVHRDSVRLGVDAPRSVPVNRAAALQSLQSIKPKSGQPLDLRRLMKGSAALPGAAQSQTPKPSPNSPASQTNPAAKRVPKPRPPQTN